MNSAAYLLLVVLGFILLATGIIIIAALAQKPTREWRVQWAQNAKDLKKSGVRTLRGEPVQPRVVGFEALWQVTTGIAPLRTVVASGTGPNATATTMANVATLAPGTVVGKVKYSPWKPAPEGPEPLTFDELLEADLIGPQNPGAVEVSDKPEIEPGQFWATTAVAAQGLWQLLSTKAGDLFSAASKAVAKKQGPPPPVPFPDPAVTAEFTGEEEPQDMDQPQDVGAIFDAGWVTVPEPPAQAQLPENPVLPAESALPNEPVLPAEPVLPVGPAIPEKPTLPEGSASEVLDDLQAWLNSLDYSQGPPEPGSGTKLPPLRNPSVLDSDPLRGNLE